ncbi:MAG: ABC transporter substrate-binding protein [Alphaproteobacteria bacterium]|jgi:phospholipid transport system substrate-binding protein|nr:ABC transporter substrate-binding protein [Alphaproteobacteria bacterium]MDP6812531.1 ABC transporter substrate-binding protein [Alphaproteobacteria bacterium]
MGGRRAVLLAAAVLLALAGPAQARPLAAGEATEFIEELGNRAVAMLSDTDTTQRHKTRQFRQLLRQDFALKGIARFTLGRYWRRANAKQRSRYLFLFEDYVVNSYAARFGSYGGETFTIVDERINDRGRAMVSTRINRKGGKPVVVQWHVHERDSRIKIVDVVIEGISMSMTQRSDFAAAIRSAGGDLDAFLDTLADKARKSAAE